MKLDVGCGNHCRGDIGIDIIKPIVRPKFFILADASHLPFRDKYFDEAFAWHVYEHLLNPQKAIEELRRVSSSSFFVVPHHLSINTYCDPTHRYLYYKGIWVTLASLRGFIRLLWALDLLYRKTQLFLGLDPRKLTSERANREVKVFL